MPPKRPRAAQPKKPKGRPGLVTRTTRSGRKTKSAPWFDQSTDEEEEEDDSTSSPVAPPTKRSSSAVAATTESPSSHEGGTTSNNEEDEQLETPRKMSPSPDPQNDPTANDEFAGYFGESPVVDLCSDSEEGDVDEITALAVDMIKSVRQPYKKQDKLSSFAGALKIKKANLLGDDPPSSINSIYNIWHADAKIPKEWKGWNLNTVAKPMYDLGQHLSSKKDANTLTTKATAAKTLIVLSEHFKRKASQQVAEQRAKNDKIKARALGGASKKTGKTIPKEINPITAQRSTDFSHCPGCKCKGSIVNLFSEERLRQMTSDFNAKHQLRLKENPKARKTGVPQMEFACMCPRSRTLRGDWENSSCIMCRARGARGEPYDPKCKMCLCDCEDEVFTLATAQAKGIRAAEKRNAKANVKKRSETGGMDALGTMFTNAVQSVVQCKDGPKNNDDAMVMVANRLAHQQFPSEAAMYEAQQYFGAPKTTLNSGEDIRSILTKGDKRYYQNNLAER
jgi:hypothetical protein